MEAFSNPLNELPRHIIHDCQNKECEDSGKSATWGSNFQNLCRYLFKNHNSDFFMTEFEYLDCFICGKKDSYTKKDMMNQM